MTSYHAFVPVILLEEAHTMQLYSQLVTKPIVENDGS